MLQLHDRLGVFAGAILNPAASVPPGLVGPDGRPSPTRFAVYRNNVAVGLIDALQANFPATARIVGEEFFRAMAREYVLHEPPTSPLLLDYGTGFPAFIEIFEPADALPYLADVARIERAWTVAYNAPDAQSIEAAVLSRIPPDRMSEVRLTLHPSVQVVRSQFPALTIWRINVADGIPEPVDIESGGEDCLISRPEADVEVRLVPEGGAEFIRALVNGSTISDAAKAGWTASAHFDLAGNIAALIGAGAFTAYSHPEQARSSEQPIAAELKEA